jgi:hypothetical protein
MRFMRVGCRLICAVALPALVAPPLAVAEGVADFGSQRPSPEARSLVDWVAGSHDNASLDFVVIDKKHATVFVFDAQARLRASSPVLLGAARGDDSVPGIGERPLALVRPYERTTPAGRFVAELGRNTIGDNVVWVDYDAAVSMHRVRTSNPSEHRLERLATPSIADNRISYGCINVPVAFFEAYIEPVFAQHPAIVYVLPEIKSAQQVFGLPQIVAVRQSPPAPAAIHTVPKAPGATRTAAPAGRQE